MGPGCGQTRFIVIDKGGGIIELFKVTLSIPFMTVLFSMDQKLNSSALIFRDLAFVEEFFYLRAF